MEDLLSLLLALISMALIGTSLAWRIYDYVVRGIVCFRLVRYAEGDARPAQRSAHTTQERIISSHV